MMGDTIRSRRRELSITQEELAHGVCSRSYLSQIERNRRIPSPEIVADLARKLGLSLDAFTEYYLDPDAGVTSNRLLFMARVLAMHGFRSDAQRCLEQAGRCQTRASRHSHEFQCSYLKTEGFLAFYDGSYREAMEKYLELLELCRRRPSDKLVLGQALFLVGNAAVHLNDYATAKTFLFEALCHVLFLDSDSEERVRRVQDLGLVTVRDLMHALITLREHRLASSLFEVISRRWDDLGISKPVVILLSEGYIDITEGRLGKACEVFQEVIRKTEDLDSLVCAYVNLGLAHRLTGDLDEALTYQTMAWNLHNEHGSYLSSQRIANEIARCYMKKGEVNAAADWLDTGADEDLQKPEPLIAEERMLLEAEVALLLDSDEPVADLLQHIQTSDLPTEMSAIATLIRTEDMIRHGQIRDAFNHLSCVRDDLWMLVETR